LGHCHEKENIFLVTSSSSSSPPPSSPPQILQPEELEHIRSELMSETDHVYRTKISSTEAENEALRTQFFSVRRDHALLLVEHEHVVAQLKVCMYVCILV
jgi:hypothetical protein